MSLFENAARSQAPLAERMRPRDLSEVAGQAHLLGPSGVLRQMSSLHRLPSMILHGPPGTGKTTIARLLAQATKSNFQVLSAVDAGLPRLRQIISDARDARHAGRATVLFIDEIHRWSRSQQDALLPHVETGLLTLLGATTENPNYEVNGALLSRTRVFALKSLTIEALVGLCHRALSDSRGLGELGVVAESDRQLAGLAHACQGDARKTLNTLGLAAEISRIHTQLDDPGSQDSDSPPHVQDPPRTPHVLTDDAIRSALGNVTVRFDKQGEEHFNVASALIKSMRASDIDAAVYWLARLLESGEDLRFIVRRLVIFASEDVGNADPQALVLAEAAAAASLRVGMPEASLALTQAVSYLALAPKSNSALITYKQARSHVRQWGPLEVPNVVRNSVAQANQGGHFGPEYRYPHDFEGGVDPEHVSYLPEPLGERLHGSTPLNKQRVAVACVGTRGWEYQRYCALRDAHESGTSSE